MPSTKLSSLSVFVPAFNEEANISLIIEDALAFLPRVAKKYEIIIIDDGSTDQTRDLVSTYAKQYAFIRLITHSKNRGYGAAIKTGLKNAKYDWIFFTDSDRQFRFDELPRFVSFAKQADFVVGYRRTRQDPLLRLILAQVLLRIWNFALFGLTLRDVDCAYKLIPTKLVRQITLTTESAITVTELIYKLINRGYSYIQVPVTHYERSYGKQTGSNPRVILRALKESLDLWEKLKSKKSK